VKVSYLKELSASLKSLPRIDVAGYHDTGSRRSNIDDVSKRPDPSDLLDLFFSHAEIP